MAAHYLQAAKHVSSESQTSLQIAVEDLNCSFLGIEATLDYLAPAHYRSGFYVSSPDEPEDIDIILVPPSSHSAYDVGQCNANYLPSGDQHPNGRHKIPSRHHTSEFSGLYQAEFSHSSSSASRQGPYMDSLASESPESELPYQGAHFSPSPHGYDHIPPSNLPYPHQPVIPFSSFQRESRRDTASNLTYGASQLILHEDEEAGEEEEINDLPTLGHHPAGSRRRTAQYQSSFYNSTQPTQHHSISSRSHESYRAPTYSTSATNISAPSSKHRLPVVQSNFRRHNLTCGNGGKGSGGGNGGNGGDVGSYNEWKNATKQTNIHIDGATFELVEECDAAESPFSWETMCKILCCHLDIAIFTTRDIKRIHRANAAAEVVQKIIFCSQKIPQNMRVAGGILTVIQKILKDGILAREVYNKELYLFIFKCLDYDKKTPEFRDLVVRSLLAAAVDGPPSLVAIHDQALKGTAKVAELIPFYEEDATGLQYLLQILQAYLSRLTAYEAMNGSSLPLPLLESLQLPRVATSLVNLLDMSDPSLPVSWDKLNLVSEILTWIAYHQSEAILLMPNNKGITLFVCFMLSSSLTIRCRGLLGLLNVYTSDFSPDIRLCNPKTLMLLRGMDSPENVVKNAGETILRHLRPELSHHALSERYRNLKVKKLPNGKPFDAYGAALRCVDFELNGPRNEDEAYDYPGQRLLGTEPSEELAEDMEVALRFHQKDFEADVLKLGVMFRMQEDLIARHANPRVKQKPGPIRGAFLTTRFLAGDGIERWPDRLFFFYSMMKSQTGPEYLKYAVNSGECKDSTRYLTRKILYEWACNVFSLGVTHVALGLYDESDWEDGRGHLRMAMDIISCAQKYELACVCGPDRQNMGLLSIAVTLLTEMPNFGPDEVTNLMATFLESKFALDFKQSMALIELRLALSSFHKCRKQAAIQWSILLEAMNKMELPPSETVDFSQVRCADPTADAMWYTNPPAAESASALDPGTDTELRCAILRKRLSDYALERRTQTRVHLTGDL
ncbi:hypothetical protein SISNIDRAFT_483880 [Sistotremastrum niveocremeum HHB9708]|uniref:ARM repeat-containing protein n=1 Tax=Sistotremastrum niveocremeum HHB9708 TaxID=1314777 RepID=A0A164X5P2_9AGAM|nr:hypothetical protein SISNIDRAFT_483880 [Sistotremastrum niveocremeum HHB9708]